jgi:hypothetical protein
MPQPLFIHFGIAATALKIMALGPSSIDMTSLLNFIKIYQLVKKLIVGTDMIVASLPYIFHLERKIG